jgi:hypothetical protein
LRPLKRERRRGQERGSNENSNDAELLHDRSSLMVVVLALLLNAGCQRMFRSNS